MFRHAIRIASCALCAQALIACSLADQAWVRHGGTAGFTVSAPAGWTASQDGESGRVSLRGQGGYLSIWPVFMPKRQLDPRSALTVDRSLAAKIWPETAWSRAEQISGGSVRLSSPHRVAALTWADTSKGVACYWYGADFGSSGPKLGPIFARILASFRLHGKALASRAGGGGGAHLSFTEHAEQGEHAFSFEAPEGWTVKSAVSRSNPYDDRPVVVASSPDRSVIIRLNDSRVPGCILPSRMLDMVGGEGHIYNSGGGVRLLILHFMRPEEALRAYLSQILSQNVQDIQVTGYHDRPELTRLLQSPFYNGVTVGDISFNCRLGGRDYKGAMECCTGMMRGSTMWGVGYLCGFLAAPGKESEGLSAVMELIKSFKTNPAWRERENARVGGLSKTLAAQFDKNRQTFMGAWESKTKTQAAVSKNWEEANLGQTTLVDPDTGQKVTVTNGHDYYWVDQYGAVRGTDIPTAPKGEDYHRLMAPPG